MADKRTGNFPDSSSDSPTRKHLAWRPGRLLIGTTGALLSLTVLFGLFQPTAEGYPPSERPLHILGDLPLLRRVSPERDPTSPPTTGQGGLGIYPPITEVRQAPSPSPFVAVSTPAPRSARRPIRRTAKPYVRIRRDGQRVAGRASWYCLHGVSACVAGRGGGLYAAAGPKLRVAMGGGAAVTAPQPWRGRSVTVCITGTTRCVRVRLIDWCQCSWKKPGEKVIDLYGDAMRVLAPNFRSLGVLRVTVYTK